MGSWLSLPSFKSSQDLLNERTVQAKWRSAVSVTLYYFAARHSRSEMRDAIRVVTRASD